MLNRGKYANPNAVAAWVINYVDRDAGESITHLKLQKLLYYFEAWYLANFDRPLFKENFEAWAHGPVCREVYAKYKGNSWDALGPVKAMPIPDELNDFLIAVYNEYGQFSAKKLETMSHEEDPWKKTRGSLPIEARCEDPIDKLLMRNYYANRLGKKEIKKLSN